MFQLCFRVKGISTHVMTTVLESTAIDKDTITLHAKGYGFFDHHRNRIATPIKGRVVEARMGATLAYGRADK